MLSLERCCLDEGATSNELVEQKSTVWVNNEDLNQFSNEKLDHFFHGKGAQKLTKR